jgi:hypothetical protein
MFSIIFRDTVWGLADGRLWKMRSPIHALNFFYSSKKSFSQNLLSGRIRHHFVLSM